MSSIQAIGSTTNTPNGPKIVDLNLVAQNTPANSVVDYTSHPTKYMYPTINITIDGVEKRLPDLLKTLDKQATVQIRKPEGTDTIQLQAHLANLAKTYPNMDIRVIKAGQ